LLSTYGGQKGIINKLFNKTNWIIEFLNLFGNTNQDTNEKITNYKSLFGITNDIKTLDISQCIFMYSGK
jgi:hypothetical protein